MSAIAIQQMAERVAALLEERLGVKGRGLGDKVRRAGGKLPRKVREAALALARAAEMAPVPKLFLQLDPEDVANDYDVCLRFLNGLDKWDRRKGLAQSWLLSLVTSLALFALLLVLFLRWRGYF